ncbi:MAG TPA: efflux transporter outer membrane subunit [Burkholderiaceae bacterium]|jgi:NodT family efflux transporter outer membrane factor (OMF) lipoprotein|nr:efflux transporter outer membrane subunit [Burkholderiaceae bacterium]
MSKRKSKLMPPAAIVLAAASLAGCAVGPTYQPPAARAPAAWHAPLPHDGNATELADWWSQFHDDTLTRLLAWAQADSPSLDQAWAKIVQARATVTTDRAAALPTLDATGSATRSKQQGTGTTTTRSATLDASWEIDLAGKARRNVEAGQARVEARIADWHDARVSLAAEVADDYTQYRGCRLLADAYDREAASAEITARSTATLVDAGLGAPSDGSLARASLASDRSTAAAQHATCDNLVKSLVALTGRDEAELVQALDAGKAGVPRPDALSVQALPAQAISQRADVASLERELAASSAEIGAAEAALYPSLSLSGSIGRSSTSGIAFTPWSFGPTLDLAVFDAGKRRANVDSAKASYDSALASYRQGVRTAVKEVEQALVNLDAAARRAQETARAADEYRKYVQALDAGWHAGTNSLLELEEGRRSAIAAEVEAITLQQDQVSDWIALYKALGGGWKPGTPATAPMASSATEQDTRIAQGAPR